MWSRPSPLVALLTGTGSVFSTQALFFSGTAVVTFGGAYAVLAFVAQRAVEHYVWLAAGEMVARARAGRDHAGTADHGGPVRRVPRGLPRPRRAGPVDRGASLASLLTTWVTFVPCFLFIFLGAPYIERLRGNASLTAALTGITAAVVGVIANLGGLLRRAHPVRPHSHHDCGPLELHLPDRVTVRPCRWPSAWSSRSCCSRSAGPCCACSGCARRSACSAAVAGLPIG